MQEQYGDFRLAGYGIVVRQDEYAHQGPDMPEGFSPDQLILVDTHHEGELHVPCSEMRRRALNELNAHYGRKLLWWLLNHQEQIPDEWKQTTPIHFYGDGDLDSPDGKISYALSLMWTDQGWGIFPLNLAYRHMMNGKVLTSQG